MSARTLNTLWQLQGHTRGELVSLRGLFVRTRRSCRTVRPVLAAIGINVPGYNGGRS